MSAGLHHIKHLYQYGAWLFSYFIFFVRAKQQMEAVDPKRIRTYGLPLLVRLLSSNINILNPSGYYISHRFNIQKFYVLLTHCNCVLCGCQNKQRLFRYTVLTNLLLQPKLRVRNLEVRCPFPCQEAAGNSVQVSSCCYW